MHLLLVEDDPMLSEALCCGLRQNAWSVDSCSDANAARLALSGPHGYSVVLLDLQLPGGSGLSVLSALRARYDDTPVLIITARDLLSERVRGLDAGADDFLVKPFHLDELYARLRALQRRHQGRVAAVLRLGEITLDPARRQVTRGATPVALSLHEYRTLLALMERPGRVVARDQLEALIYPDACCIESNTIAVYVHQLRRKLGEGLIATVHGFGYRIGEARA